MTTESGWDELNTRMYVNPRAPSLDPPTIKFTSVWRLARKPSRSHPPAGFLADRR